MRFNRFRIIFYIVLAAGVTFVIKSYYMMGTMADAAAVAPVNAGSKPAAKSVVVPPKADATDVAGIYREAEALKREGRFAEAVALYEKAVSIEPSLAETYLRLGLLYFKLQMPSKSEEFYLKAVSHGLDNAEIYFHLGYIEEVQGRLEKALDYYLKSEIKGSGNPELFYNIGNVYARFGKGAEAIAYYKRVVSMNPQHMDAFVNLSTVSFQLNDFAGARFYLDKAVELGYKAPLEYLKVLEEKK